MSDILDAAKQFKAELLQQNDAALNQMAKAYAETWTRLKSRLDALTVKINEARKNGEEFSIDWLFRQQRYQELMTQCETEIINFSRDTAMPIIRQQQQLSLDFGEQHSLSLMKTSLGPVPDAVREAGLSVSWNQVPKKALENIVGFLGDGSPLAYKFAGLPSAVSDGIKNAIIAGMAAGQNPQVIARTVRREYAGGLSNAVTVCRTEAMRAYRTASHENYRANDDVVEGWIWSAGHSSRTCAACWGMDGTLHPLDEDLNDHVRGRCCAIPQTKSWQELFPDLDLSDVKETRAEPWDPETAFKKLSEKQQRDVLGKGRYEMWADGKIKLRNIPVEHKSAIWSNSYQPATLEDLARFTQRTAKGRYEGNKPLVKMESPNPRHLASRAALSKWCVKDNSIVLPDVDMSEDVRLINEGKAVRLGTSGNTFEVNSRWYGVEEGVKGPRLYPIKGVGIIPVDRGSYKALQILRKMGYNESALNQLRREKIYQSSIDRAVYIWRKVNSDAV